MGSVFFLVLRRMRAPLILLILIYGIAILGLVLTPGVDANGQPQRMDFFHAFYFVSYTATTIGFGEFPNTFTVAQRMWALCTIYLTVIGWAYGIATMLSILQDKVFQRAVLHSRFSAKVRRLTDPFYLICGYGQTGRVLCRELDDAGLRAVVLDIREERINELGLVDYRADVPAFAGDAAAPELLRTAGLLHPQCQGVLALTGDENVNLAVAIAAHALRPPLLSICRAKTDAVAHNMASFGANRVLNMFDAVGARFRLSLHAPQVSRLWFTLNDFPGQPLPPLVQPPRGHWVIMGYGRFGHAVRAALLQEGSTTTVIDIRAPQDLPASEFRVGEGVEAAELKAAGIEHAIGLVACTDRDTQNLSAIATARQINPGLFVVARQNLATNSELFDAFRPDIKVIRSQVMAQECLRAMTNPMLARFLELIQQEKEATAAGVLAGLSERCEGRVPEHWLLSLGADSPSAVYGFLVNPLPPLRLSHLLADPHNPNRTLPCMPLLLAQCGEEMLLPRLDTPLFFGAQILFAGEDWAQRAQEQLTHQYPLIDYVRTGQMPPVGWLMRRFAAWQAARKAARQHEKTPEA